MLGNTPFTVDIDPKRYPESAQAGWTKSAKDLQVLEYAFPREQPGRVGCSNAAEPPVALAGATLWLEFLPKTSPRPALRLDCC
jgi:hypothetical protein